MSFHEGLCTEMRTLAAMYSLGAIGTCAIIASCSEETRGGCQGIGTLQDQQPWARGCLGVSHC